MCFSLEGLARQIAPLGDAPIASNDPIVRRMVSAHQHRKPVVARQRHSFSQDPFPRSTSEAPGRPASSEASASRNAARVAIPSFGNR
jgi:hypothetical protein